MVYCEVFQWQTVCLVCIAFSQLQWYAEARSLIDIAWLQSSSTSTLRSVITQNQYNVHDIVKRDCTGQLLSSNNGKTMAGSMTPHKSSPPKALINLFDVLKLSRAEASAACQARNIKHKTQDPLPALHRLLLLKLQLAQDTVTDNQIDTVPDIALFTETMVKQFAELSDRLTMQHESTTAQLLTLSERLVASERQIPSLQTGLLPWSKTSERSSVMATCSLG